MYTVARVSIYSSNSGCVKLRSFAVSTLVDMTETVSLLQCLVTGSTMDTMVPSELELELEQGGSTIELRSQQACRNLQLELYFLSF
jgi:hypothetical protein